MAAGYLLNIGDNMKRVSFLISIIVMSCLGLQRASAQTRYGIWYDEVCWTNGDVDSSIVAMWLTPSQTSLPTLLYYVDRNMNPVTVAAGSLALCWCAPGTGTPCCPPEVTSETCSQPTINPFNPFSCGFSAVLCVENITNVSQITVTFDDAPFPFSFVNNCVVVNSGNVGRTGPHTIRITLNNGIGEPVVHECTVDCS